MSDKLTKEDKEWLVCSSYSAGVLKESTPVIPTSAVKIAVHNLRFDRSDLVNFIRQLEPDDTEMWCDQTVKSVADHVERYFEDLDYDNNLHKLAQL